MLVHNLPRCLFVDVDEPHVCLLAREGLHDRCADAAAAAGHESNFARKGRIDC